MIVECESCRTRFRLDDAKVPATGAKVRCSRCKTAFIVHRPSATRDEAIEEVVAEATAPGGPRSPDVTQDLFDVSASGGRRATAAPSAGPDDEKWEFDEEPRPASPPALPAARASAARERQAAPAEEEDLDSLGSPSEWNLLGAGKADAAAARGPEPGEPEPSPEPEPQRRPRRMPERARREEPRDAEPSVDASIARVLDDARAERPAEKPAGGSARDRLHEATARVISGAAWIAASALTAVGLALALMPRAQLEASPQAAMSATFEGAQHPIVVRTLESAVAGSLVVVRGELPERALRGAAERLRARWVDASGKPLGERGVLASAPRDSHALRESSLERLQAEPNPITGRAFEVVFDALPREAAGISLKREVIPPPPPLEPAPTIAPVEDAATSSRPSLPLSSE